MRKKWTAAFLALVLCAQGVFPAAAQEAELVTADDAELIIEQQEEPGDPNSELPEELAELWSDMPEADAEPAADAAPVADAVPEADAKQTEIALDAEHFPDEAFRTYIGKFDTDGSKGFSAEEIAAVTEIDVAGNGIDNLTGVEYFTALTGLYCDNNQLTALDVSRNKKLKYLQCPDNQITDLNLQANTALVSLVCSDNQISALDISKNTKLQDLRCAGNQLAALDISKNASLSMMDCSRNELTVLNASGCTNLYYLWCSHNRLTSLDVSGDTKLQWLDCSQNRIASMDVTDALNVYATGDEAMNILNCADNQLTSLELGSKKYMKGLICSNNMLGALDLSQLPDLRQLECANNALQSLAVVNNTKLQQLDCSGNQITSLDLQKLNITETTALPNCSGQKLPMKLVKTEGGFQVDLKSLIGEENMVGVVYMPKKEFETCEEKSTFGNVILFEQENEALNGTLQNGILTFAVGKVPETLEFMYATGYQKRKGDREDVLLQVILQHEHEYQLIEEASTCTQEGATYEECMACGAEKEGSRTVLAATGHRYGEYRVTQEPTIFADGRKTRVCSVCGSEQSEVLPKLPGAIVLNAEKLPVQVKEKNVTLQSLVSGLMEGDAVESWTSSDESVLTILDDGTIRTKKTGQAEVTAVTKSGAIAVVTVKVQKRKVSTESITGLSKNMAVTAGKSIILKPVITPISSQDKVTYTTSDKKVASVSAKGVVRGIKAGTAKITVKSGSRKFTVKVKVTNPAVKAIKKVPAKKTVKVGKTFQLKPKLSPAGSSGKITYKSSNKKVATVSAKGKVKGKKKGTAVITVSVGSVKVKCKVTVK